MKDSKPLYSSDLSSVVNSDATFPGLNNQIRPGKKDVTYGSDRKFWYYIFVHHFRIDTVKVKLENRFPVFIHKTVSYIKKEGHVKSVESSTIPGLMFVQGDLSEIRLFLKENFPGLYLVTDRTSGCIASINDKEMQSFMKISEVSGPGIRILQKPFDYYAEGNMHVRVTSGILKGSEGYIVRISREKCLVTKLGNITVAIGGILKETFDYID